jgi:hypothetical protein
VHYENTELKSGGEEEVSISIVDYLPVGRLGMLIPRHLLNRQALLDIDSWPSYFMTQ